MRLNIKAVGVYFPSAEALILPGGDGRRGGGRGRGIKILQRVFICSQHLLSDQYF